MAHQSQRVTTLEIRPTLAALARANLQRAGIGNAQVVEADGAKGHGAQAPFDAIVLSGSVAEAPAALLAQLKNGGRLIAIVGQEPVMRALLITRMAEQQYKRVELFDTFAPRLDGFGEPTRFHF
jgi:protein-L-isoaspartate(D-aspartate) O-methyltransferase